GIHRFDPADQQFDDALVSSAVIWIQKGKPTTERLTNFSYGGNFEQPRVTRQIPLIELASSQKWSGLVFCAKEEATHTYNIGDFFFIKRGLATGSNSFFVVSEAKARELGISDRFLQPVLPSPRNLEQNIVDTDERGEPLIQERRFLIRCELSEEELRKVNPSLADYFDSGRSIATDTYICRHRTPWFSQENRPAAPIVCTYMGRNLNNREKPFRFILNHSEATALNVYLMLYPKGLLAQALELNPNLIDEVWKILSSMDAKSLLDEGRVYGGGLYKLEPRELAKAPADELYKIVSATLGNQLGQLQIFGQQVA
ncbi:MAG: hypothetical protein ACRD3K_14155, partial [Edaphobacter sp.]